jgi:hypothetical protein
MRHGAESIFVVENLRESESIFETALASESGDLEALFDEQKSKGRKSRDTVPIKKGQITSIFNTGTGYGTLFAERIWT